LISAGSLADFVVLSHDIIRALFAEILDAKVAPPVFDGHFVYQDNSP